MNNISKKNMESFEAIYNQFYIPVYKYILKRLSSKEISEDLTSDVFYSCFKSYDKYDPSKASAATWIYSIANNRLKNYYRDRKDYYSIEETDLIDSLPDGTDMDKAIYLTQMKEHLMEALESVGSRERTIINLRYFSELTSEEIAAELGTTAGNVRVIIARTLKKLTVYFQKNGIRWE